MVSGDSRLSSQSDYSLQNLNDPAELPAYSKDSKDNQTRQESPNRQLSPSLKSCEGPETQQECKTDLLLESEFYSLISQIQEPNVSKGSVNMTGVQDNINNPTNSNPKPD